MLGDISNPMIADVAGALSFRQAQMEKEEQKRREIKFRQLASQAIPDLPEDSPIRQLMAEDPVKAAALAHALDIPLNKGDQFARFSQDVKQATQLAHADLGSAHDYIGRLIPEYQKMGMSTAKLQQWYDGVNQAVANNDEQGLKSFYNALGVMNDSLNPQAIKEGFTLSEGQTRYDSKGNPIASVKKTYDPNAEGNQATAHAKDLAEYKRLVAAGDPTAEGFGQMIGIVSREGKELTSGVTKILDDLTEENKVANYNVTRYSTLANKIRAADYESGLAGKGAEVVKSLFGNEDEVTAMKKELALIRNSEALKSLPAGSASEKDVAMVMEPMPTANSNPKYVANWLDAYAKVSAGAAKYTEAKADFVAKNGSLRDKEGNTFIKTWKSQQEKPSAPAKSQSAADRLNALTGGQ